MLEYGKETGTPEAYRITLAVSVALLIHTLFMATFPFALPEHNHNPVTVQVQLMPQGSRASEQKTPSQPSIPVRAAPFTITDTEASAPPSRSVSTTSSPQSRSAPEPPREKPQPSDIASAREPVNTPAPEPPEPSVEVPGRAASAPSVAGESFAPQDDTEQQVTMKSEKPSEASYLSLLVQTIAKKAKIPKLDDFEKGQVLSVELELSLMSNGTLVGARITDSSGHDGLDQRVYRAALAASPYPEPPSSGGRQQRFRVEVKYTF